MMVEILEGCLTLMVRGRETQAAEIFIYLGLPITSLGQPSDSPLGLVAHDPSRSEGSVRKSDDLISGEPERLRNELHHCKPLQSYFGEYVRRQTNHNITLPTALGLHTAWLYRVLSIPLHP